MANLFLTIRNFIYVAVILASGVVLGLAGNFANLFLPNIHRPYVIFSLIVPTLTIVLFILTLLRSQPRVDGIALFILIVLWLTMGAWSEDVIGHVECFSLSGTTPTKLGTMPLQNYCYQMKTIEAFSWAVFCALIIWFILLISLVTMAASRGRYHAWEESMSEVPWFGQLDYGAHYGPQPMYGGAQFGAPQFGVPGGPAPYVIQQTPGHSVVIQPGAGGGPPMVTQVPGSVQSVV